jgi:hypothetical protein
MLRADFREFHEQVATDFIRYVGPFKHMRYRNHFSFSIVCLIQMLRQYEYRLPYTMMPPAHLSTKHIVFSVEKFLFQAIVLIIHFYQ